MDPFHVQSVSKPIPVPRAMKKPVPLPRSRDMNSNSKVSEVDSKRGGNLNENHVKDNAKSVTKSIKHEFKSASESVQERGKAVLEGTRVVSARFEKSVRSMIDKRRTGTGLQSSSTKEKEVETIDVPALPSQDIFQSISFQSPLEENHDVEYKEPLASGENLDSSDDDISTALPPHYPPPPLPDESVYDEVQSVISSNVSSHSSNYDPYYCSSLSGSVAESETLYEDISMMRGQASGSPSSLGSVHRGEVLRSDSWNFYDHASKLNLQTNVAGNSDTADADPIYNNDDREDPTSTADADPIYNNDEREDSASAAFDRTISCSSGLTSVYDGLEALQNFIEDEIDEAFSEGGSSKRRSSESVQNDLYYLPNRECTNAPEIPMRNKSEGKRKMPSQSVMIEFDPLYENITDSNHTDNASLNYEQLSLAQSLSPYGKINKIVVPKETVVEETESESEDVCPVIPPRHYDSIEPSPDVPTSTNHSELAEKIQPLPRMPAKSLENLVLPVNTKQSPEIPKQVPVKPKRKLVPLQPIPTQKTVVDKMSIGLMAPSVERASSVPKDDGSSNKLRNTTLVRWSSMKKALRQVADGSRRPVKVTESSSEQAIERPNMTRHMATHSGILYRTAVGERGRDFLQRYCVLAEGRLTCYSDTSRSEVRDVISLNSILSIQLVLDRKVSADGEDLHCLEVNVSWKNRSHMFGSTGSTERRVWMQKMLESLTTDFPMRISSDFNRAGWCYMKEGISGEWKSAWILLNKRTLFYCINNQPDSLQEIDLRKARCVDLQDCSPNSPKVEEKGQLILVDFPGQSLYLQMDVVRETLAWRNIIKAASVENGPNLSQQQLTREDVPAIVDKCINFVFAHGSLSEGIYRRSGANSSVQRLLAQFRQDAWSVQLTRQEYTEFDVASVLKRFFRDLPESLLTTELHGQLCDIAEGKCGEVRLDFYRKALEKLPPINFLTLRKLLSHLFYIHEQHEKTLMPIENLASIWGPTLMHIEGAASDSLDRSRVESSVVADLISLYPRLFDVDDAETKREKRMQEALERLHAVGPANLRPNKPSGDLKVWVHIGSRDNKNCVNVTIGPQRLAGEVCSELSSRMSLPAHELCLQEVVSGGALTRPLHYAEKVLSTVLRWGYWDDADRKDNCLVLCKNTMVSEILPRSSLPAMVSGELKFADQKSKNFKSYLFEFSQAKLSYYKDKSGSVKLGEWKIEDIVWYIGHEPKRNPHMRWAITFVDRNNLKKRSKDNPYFGCTIAGSLKEDQIGWLTAMMVGEYQQNLVSHPVLIE